MQISRVCRYSTLNISETTQDRDSYNAVLCDLSNVNCHFWWPWATPQGHDILQRQITRKLQKLELYLQWRTNRKSYIIYWMVPVSMTSTHNRYFKDTSLFDFRYLGNGTDVYERCSRMALMWPPVADYSRPGDQQLERLGRQRWNVLEWGWMRRLVLAERRARRLGKAATRTNGPKVR